MKTVERLLSVQEAGEKLGLSCWTIRRWIKFAKITPVRLGSRVLVEESELQRIIESAKQSLRKTEEK